MLYFINLNWEKAKQFLLDILVDIFQLESEI